MELVRIRPMLNPSTCETKNSDLIPQGDKQDPHLLLCWRTFAKCLQGIAYPMREKEEAEQPVCRSLGTRGFIWSTAETGHLVVTSVIFKWFHFGAN